MQANKIVTINGRKYDAVTGLAVTAKTVAPAKKLSETAQRTPQTPAASVHASPQRSQTLHRRAAKKQAAVTKRPQPGRYMDISRNKNVARFAAHPAAPKKEVVSTPDIKAKTHPVAAKAAARPVKSISKPAPTSKQIKEAAISSALAKGATKEPKKKRFSLKWSRHFTIITGALIVLIIGALLTYANLPAISVGFAAAQSGINATYPEYRPDGFRLSQPVTFKDGEVLLEFKSNTGNGGYTITQTRSSWDSSAVLDNVVRKDAGDNYITTQERGLTIYAYKNNATWVNGGILYKIKSTAPLSGEQIRHIATSL